MSIVDVMVIGNVTVDHVLTLDAPPPRGDKAYASALCSYPGGQAANAAYTMADLGLSVRFVGRFGADAADQESWNALAPELFAGVRAFYTDGTEPSATLRGLRLARAAGVMTIADAESVTDWLAEGLPWPDELAVPAVVLRHLAGRGHEVADGEPLPPAELLVLITRRGPRTVIATAGAAGCAAVVADPVATLISVPALDICPVDTTGAGVAGGYLAARLRRLQPRRALEFGTAVAAAACADPGPRAALDRLRELASKAHPP